MKKKSIWASDLVLWLLIGSIIMFILFFVVFGFSETGLRYNIRWSAKISFVLFNTAFVASSVQYFWKNAFSYWLLMNRKYIGITFAIIHIIHLLFLVVLQFYFHPVFELARSSSIFGGSVAYFFVFIMLMSSFKSTNFISNKKLWKIVHTFGGYWIWTIFMTSYYRRVLTESEYTIQVAILLFVFVLRVIKYISSGKF